MNSTRFKSSLEFGTLLLLPLLLLWGGKVCRDIWVVQHTGITGSWIASVENIDEPFQCDLEAKMLVRRVSDGKSVREIVLDSCSYKVNVPAGKYEVLIYSRSFGDNNNGLNEPEKVEVHDGQMAEAYVWIR